MPSVSNVPLNSNAQADIPAKDLVEGLLVPQLSRRTLSVAVAALGALVMPYNVYFQVWESCKE